MTYYLIGTLVITQQINKLEINASLAIESV